MMSLDDVGSELMPIRSLREDVGTLMGVIRSVSSLGQGKDALLTV